MKNNFLLSLIIYIFLSSVLFANEFRFEAEKIQIIKDQNLILAENGTAFSEDSNIEIEANKFEYDKEKNLLKAFDKGTALIKSDNLKIQFDLMEVDQKKSIIKATGNVKIYDEKKELIIKTNSIVYDKIENIISSKSKSFLTDKLKNVFRTDNFQYEINKNILKVENANFKDVNNNNFNTPLAFINTKTNKLFGKDVSVNLNNSSFNKDNDPRLKGNSITHTGDITEITKGVFTTCKKTDDCPPWELSAKKIQHNKKEKIINYEHAWLKLYNLPVMYFPKFFHPDPTVKRQSGFLIPTIKNSSNKDNYLKTPYFFAIAQNKDATFTPRFFTKDKILLQTEYRQVNLNSSHITDFSFFKEKNLSSKNHFFYELTKKINFMNFTDNDFDLKIQQTSNDTYLRKNKLRSPLIQDAKVLENSFELDLYSDDLSINSNFTIYEDLDKERNDRFEYILPQLNLVKKLENKTNLVGDFTLKSKNLARNYNTNVFEKTNVNDLNFKSIPKINNMGFYNNYDFIVKNANSDAQNSSKFKENTSHYVSGLFQFNSSLPLINENDDYQKILKPKFSIKAAPGNTKDVSDSDTRISVDNVYSIDRISSADTIEGGLSITYGNDFTIFDKKGSREILEFKLANNLRFDENENLPKNNSIGQKTSDIFSEIKYSPNQYISTKYSTAIKNNLTDINYENLTTEFKVNNFVTTFDYLNENNTQDKDSYLTNTTKFTIDDSNNIVFETRENKSSDITEYYKLMYQYKNDCLSASIEYNKDYYSDRDIKPDETLMFNLTIIPFARATSPNMKN